MDSKNQAVRGVAERIAMNTPVQGTAADIMKVAMIRVARKLPALGAAMVLQVHDELVLDVPKAQAEAAAALLRTEMAAAAQLSVPLDVSTGSASNWMDL